MTGIVVVVVVGLASMRLMPKKMVRTATAMARTDAAGFKEVVVLSGGRGSLMVSLCGWRGSGQVVRVLGPETSGRRQRVLGGRRRVRD